MIFFNKFKIFLSSRNLYRRQHKKNYTQDKQSDVVWKNVY